MSRPSTHPVPWQQPLVLASPFLERVATQQQQQQQQQQPEQQHHQQQRQHQLPDDATIGFMASEDSFTLPLPPSEPVLGVGNMHAMGGHFPRSTPNSDSSSERPGNRTSSSSSLGARRQRARRGGGYRSPPDPHCQRPINGASSTTPSNAWSGLPVIAADFTAVKDTSSGSPVFRGYSWGVCQDVLSDLKGQARLPEDSALRDPELQECANTFVHMVENCLGREEHDPRGTHLACPALQPKKRRIVGVWRALHTIGEMPVRWYRWANLVVKVAARAAFNAGVIYFNFTQREQVLHGVRPGYKYLVLAVIYFEVLLTTCWVAYLAWAVVALAWNLRRWEVGGRRATLSLQVVGHTVGLVKIAERLGTFSAMRGAKHAISIMRVVRWYRRLYLELKNRGNYYLHHVMTLSHQSLVRLINKWYKAAAEVMKEPERQSPPSNSFSQPPPSDFFSPFDKQRDQLGGATLPVTSLRPHGRSLTSRPSLSIRISTTFSTTFTSKNTREAVQKLPGCCVRCIAAAPKLLVKGLTSLVLLCVLLAMATWPLWGLAAFFIKLCQLKFVSQETILDWTLAEVLMLLAFVNQLAALECSEQYRLEGKLQLLFWGSDGEFCQHEKDAEHCFQKCVVLESWLRPGGGLLAGAAKLAWLGPDDINSAFIDDWEERKHSFFP